MNKEAIYVFAKWQAKEGNADKVLNLLSEVIVRTREEEGNLIYKVHRSTTDANTILLYEAYSSESAVAAHRSSKHFQQIVVEQIVPLLENREVTLATAIAE